jgi:hypothetical protein
VLERVAPLGENNVRAFLLDLVLNAASPSGKENDLVVELFEQKMTQVAVQ